MMRPALTLAALLAATPTLAQEKLTIADCGAEGCRCTLSAVTMEEAGIVLDTPAPEGTATLVRLNGEYIWSPLSSKTSTSPQAGMANARWNFSMQLIPEDGAWIGTVTNRSISQCPPGLDAAVAPVTDAMVFPRDIAWGNGFPSRPHPH